MLKPDTQVGVLVGVAGPDLPICEARDPRPDSRPLRAACNGLLAGSRAGREEPASAMTGERVGTPASATPEVHKVIRSIIRRGTSRRKKLYRRDSGSCL